MRPQGHENDRNPAFAGVKKSRAAPSPLQSAALRTAQVPQVEVWRRSTPSPLANPASALGSAQHRTVPALPPHALSCPADARLHLAGRVWSRISTDRRAGPPPISTTSPDYDASRERITARLLHVLHVAAHGSKSPTSTDHGRQPARDLPEEAACISMWNRIAEEIVKRLRHVPHREAGCSIEASEIVDDHDVRTVQAREFPGLGDETLAGISTAVTSSSRSGGASCPRNTCDPEASSIDLPVEAVFAFETGCCLGWPRHREAQPCWKPAATGNAFAEWAGSGRPATSPAFLALSHTQSGQTCKLVNTATMDGVHG